MLMIMNPDVTEKEVAELEKRLEECGCHVSRSREEKGLVLRLSGEIKEEAEIAVRSTPFVKKVVNLPYPFELVSRMYRERRTVFTVGGVEIGGEKVVIMAGPCAVEGRDTFIQTAEAVKQGGADILRGGAYKPRSSPYSFQGLGEEGLKILAEARSLTGLPVVTEVLDHASVEVVAEYADILQVGARNMQNFSLLKELGQSGKPVLIKRGMSATIEEWLMAAEYLLSEGNGKVILCERGIRTFERYTRNTLDLSAVPIAKELSHLPVFVDPSHGTGQWRWVSPMSLAAVAAGADGLIIEVHSSPKEALCDGKQSLLPEKFYHMVSSLKKVAKTVGRSL
ncbi:MAG: 3-deoxy-7-phosphoheptulonate synthase [Dethiobacteria bacterium]